MATTADFRNGLCIIYNQDIYTIVSFQHVKPGKGGAFVRTKLKSITSGKVIENTFNAGVKITTARIERKPAQFLYQDGEAYHFMDTASYDQITLPAELLESPELFKEGQEVELLVYEAENRVLTCELPPFINLRVQYTEPGFKGDTATKTLKPATLETGCQLQVPLFIDIDDVIKVDTRTKSYVERVRETT